jgi:hypothetical protein
MHAQMSFGYAVCTDVIIICMITQIHHFNAIKYFSIADKLKILILLVQ